MFTAAKRYVGGGVVTAITLTVIGSGVAASAQGASSGDSTATTVAAESAPTGPHGKGVSATQAMDVRRRLNAVVYETHTALPAPNADMSVDSASGTATLNGDSLVTVSTPSDGPGTPAGRTTVLEGVGGNNMVSVQPIADGLRAAIDIDSAAAPEAYRFQIGGDVATLGLNADGSVSMFDARGDQIALVAAPWAIDASGRPVPTHYAIEGTTLIQVVRHREGDYTYGIVADPTIVNHWWGFDVNLDRRDMSYLGSATAAGAAAYVAARVPYAPAKAVIAGVGYLLVQLAKAASRAGVCLSLHYTWFGNVVWETFGSC